MAAVLRTSARRADARWHGTSKRFERSQGGYEGHESYEGFTVDHCLICHVVVLSNFQFSCLTTVRPS
jgi:hypothetical protein